MGIKNLNTYRKASKGRNGDGDATDGFLCILARNYVVGWVKSLGFEFWKKKFFPSREGGEDVIFFAGVLLKKSITAAI